MISEFTRQHGNIRWNQVLCGARRPAISISVIKYLQAQGNKVFSRGGMLDQFIADLRGCRIIDSADLPQL